MKLHLVPARQGVHWVRNGFRIFFKRPIVFCVLFVVYMVAAQLLVLLWPVGTALLFALVPLASLGFMVATRNVLGGLPATPAVFIEPLRRPGPPRRTQMRLGLAYAAAMGLVLWLVDSVGGAQFEALQEAAGGGHASPETLGPLLADPSLLAGMALLAGLTSLLAVPFWHAPALAHWGGQGWGKALFFSTVACWRNRGAFTLYGLTWGGVLFLFGIVANTVFALLGMPEQVMLAAAPAALMFSTVFYASLYFTFADCFIPGSGSPPPPAPAPLPAPSNPPSESP